MHRLFFVLILLIATQASAVDVANLYQSQSPVSSQSEEERLKAAPDILRQVILKVVGNSETLKTADLAPILAQSEQLIQQYQYHRVNSVQDDLTLPDQLEVLVSFKQSLVDKALTTLGLPIWSKSRPETIVWLAVDDGRSRSLVGANEQSTISQEINSAAQLRGLPILFPVMDLEDQSQVKFTDLSAGFYDTIELASQRYGAPLILMVKVETISADIVQITWNVLISGQSEQWTSRGDTVTAVTAGMNEFTNRLANRFSQRIYANTSSEELVLHINNVRNYADYVQVSKYLTDLQNVSDVQTSNIIGDAIELRVSFSGDITVLNRTLAVDRLLIEESYSSVSTLTYRFSP